MPPIPEDLALCRDLHLRRRVPEPALRAALAVVAPGRSLAAVLVERGLITPAELGQPHAAPPRPQTGMRLAANIAQDPCAAGMRPAAMDATYDPDTAAQAHPAAARPDATFDPDANPPHTATSRAVPPRPQTGMRPAASIPQDPRATGM